jgi:pimeloyl-ACP methyl ester carboxylesterase
VLVHGGSAHARWWDFVAPRFTGGFRVYALDLRGHGESDHAGAGAYRHEDYAADVAALLAHVGGARPVLVGHSLGGFVVLRHAVAHPRELGGLVLVDARAWFAPSGARYMQLLRMLGPGEYESLDDAVERFRPLPKETCASPEVLAHVARHSFRRDGSGRWVARFDRESLAEHAPFDFRERLGDLAFPVLFVRGELSRVVSREIAADLAGRCPSGEWSEIAGAHHHVLLDRPDALAEAIGRFLRS